MVDRIKAALFYAMLTVSISTLWFVAQARSNEQVLKERFAGPTIPGSALERSETEPVGLIRHASLE